MKHVYHKIYISILLLSCSVIMLGQSGINTSTPNGALDLNSTISGIIYPVVTLTDVTVQTITNPNPANANIIAGTTVYNTNTNTPANISNSVYPGIYVWNGDSVNPRWVPQFSKKDNKLFEQDTSLRTESNAGNQTVSFDTSTNYPFVPKYNGNYKIEVRMHYGGGDIDIPTDPQLVNLGVQEGVFAFTWNGGTTYSFKVGSYSSYNNGLAYQVGGNPWVNSNSFTQISYAILETLDTNSPPYTFGLTFNQEDAPGFVDDGNLTNGGKGYITISDNIKCTIEISYIGE